MISVLIKRRRYLLLNHTAYVYYCTMIKHQKLTEYSQLPNRSLGQGFTVVELIIVIAVIDILVAIVIPSYKGIIQRASDTERKTDLTSLSAQLEYYFGRHGAYPNRDSLNNSGFRENNKISTGNNDNFLADPKNTSTKTLSSSGTPSFVYSYIPEPAGCISPTLANGNKNTTAGTFCNSYRLIARLEDTSDPEKDPTITSDAYYVKRHAASN